jgi:uncharacterized membrane protein
MLILIAGLVIFFAVHAVRMVAPGWRDRQIAVNERRWKGLYALASLVGFVLIVWGWMAFRAEAPQVYAPPDWGRHAAELFVLLAFIALPAAYSPAVQIRRWTGGHPMLAAVILWSAGHLFANGDLASVLLFGGFLVYGIANRVAVISRGPTTTRGAGWRGDVIAAAIGIVAYLVFGLWLHGLLFVVNPFG